MIHLDTSFLIDLLREVGRERPGAASAFLHQLMDEELGISVFVACELFAGVELSTESTREMQKVQRLCNAFQVTYPDERFPLTYGKLLAQLERNRQKISAMDLLIATTALTAEASLVTRNVKDFSRVPGLRLIHY